MGKNLIESKLKIMDIDEDFDFDMAAVVRKWEAQGSLMGKMMDGFVFEVPEVGDVVSSTYVGKEREYLLFEHNYKDYIRVEARPHETRYLKNTEVGEKVDVLIVDVRERDFIIRGSLSALYETRAHETLKSIPEDQHVMAHVRELTPAGYNVDIYYEGVTLPGFMPNTLAGINKLYNPDSVLNRTIEVMIESFSNDEGTYIVSRRKYLQSLIKDETARLSRGVVYTGHVTGTAAYGVFVEFNGCLTGMIHKTNLNPAVQEQIDLILPGTEIDFYVKEIIQSNPYDKIILTQVLRDTLWDTIRVGQSLKGRIREHRQFGALVQLDDETMGLLPTAEVEKYKSAPKEGDEVDVRVVRVLRQNRKIFLIAQP